MAFCITVLPRCKPVCEDYCNIPVPQVKMLDNGAGEANNRDVYMNTTCKLQVTNHQEMVEAGYSYDYEIYAPDAKLSANGVITWTEPSWGGGDITLNSRQLLFKFYKDNKCWSSLVYTIYPIEANIIYWVNVDGTSGIIKNTNDSLSMLFDGNSNVASITVQNIMQNVTSMSHFCYNCYSLKEFVCNADTSNITSMFKTWTRCRSLTSFSLIDTSSVTVMHETWNGCSRLTSFPLIDTSSVTNMSFAWNGCSGLTSFPLIDTSSVTNMSFAWEVCSGLTSFPLIDTSSVTNMSNAWSFCTGLTSFPLIDTSSVTDMNYTWSFCTGLTSFPQINTSSVTDMSHTWSFCWVLASFPLIDTSSVTDMGYTWLNCFDLTSFGGLSDCTYADKTTFDATPLSPKPCGL